MGTESGNGISFNINASPLLFFFGCWEIDKSVTCLWDVCPALAEMYTHVRAHACTHTHTHSGILKTWRGKLISHMELGEDSNGTN